MLLSAAKGPRFNEEAAERSRRVASRASLAQEVYLQGRHPFGSRDGWLRLAVR